MNVETVPIVILKVIQLLNKTDRIRKGEQLSLYKSKIPNKATKQKNPKNVYIPRSELRYVNMSTCFFRHLWTLLLLEAQLDRAKKICAFFFRKVRVARQRETEEEDSMNQVLVKIWRKTIFKMLLHLLKCCTTYLGQHFANAISIVQIPS